ncbi:MAG: flagellar export protein FliJ [Nitrosomonas sp.]|nr:MAG: flagellar export protein FliJ [Nitrosomonas sp.]
MAAATSLKILLELAEQRTDSAAKELGRLNLHYQEAVKKLNLLVQYRQSYQVHFHAAMERGADHTGWTNFMAFMSKLDAAIAEQRQTVSYTEKKKTIGAAELLGCQRKLKSYSVLVQRQQTQRNLKLLKDEQKLQDEFALNAIYRGSFPPKED